MIGGMSYTLKDMLEYLCDLQALVHLKSMMAVSNMYFYEADRFRTCAYPGHVLDKGVQDVLE